MTASTGHGPCRAEKPGADCSPSSLIRARVCAGDVSTSYVQAGEGRPVVVLAGASESDATSPLFLGRLARHLRVFAPTMEHEGRAKAGENGGAPVAFSEWLRDFIDGLGLGPVGLVAGEPHGVQALGFSLTDPERVHRVALVFRGEPDPVVAAASARDAFVGAGTHVMVLRLGTRHGDPGTSVASSSTDLVRFLTDQAEPTTRE